MNKLVYTGPTCYLGQWHFTRAKIYDVHSFSITINFIVADNDVNYYIDKNGKHHKDHHDKNFITLEKWRELQLNKVLD